MVRENLEAVLRELDRFILLTLPDGQVDIREDLINRIDRHRDVEFVVGELGGRSGEELVEVLSRCGVDARVEASFEGETYYDAVSAADLRDRYCTYPLAQQFASLYLTVGHAKSTLAKDGAFAAAFAASPKWLRVVE